ncbi:MAG: PD40 domain-containing protein [Anaerolineales bacterium]|nr:PD40 domain-containing protein [Anaerolineales bacterium]
MRQHIYLMALPFVIIMLSACGGSDTAETIASIPTLDSAAWPTAVATTPTPTATPFPMYGQAKAEAKAEVSIQSASEEIDEVTVVEAVPVRDDGRYEFEAQPQVIEARATGEAEAVEPAALADTDENRGLVELSAIAARIGRVEVEVRSGPGTEYAPIATLNDAAEPLTILGVDTSRQWALIEPTHADSRLGWAPVADVAPSGDLDTAPAIVTAWVESNGEPVRSGPGIFHDPVGALAINTLVQVHGINEAHSWVLVQPIGSEGLGWVRLQNLTIHSHIADLPPAPEPAVAPAEVEPAMTFREDVAPGRLVLATASGGDIFTINSDGSDLRRLTGGLDPALSPDGQTVAFTVWDQGEAGNGTVRLIDIDGSNERVVHEFVKQPKGPDWSPDGTQLVINFQNGGRLEANRSCHDAGRTPPMNAYDIEVAVNKREREVRLCWTVPPDPHWDLRVINLADGRFEDVDGGTYAFRPAWDPVQPWRVVSDGGRGLLASDIVNPAAGYTLLTEQVTDGSPVFSPDGRFIAFSASAQVSGGAHDIYRLNRDGSGRVRLTQTPLWVSVQPDDAPQWNNVSPAWSPDGTQIAFLTDRTGRWEIWLMNADGSNPRPMFSEAMNAQFTFTYNFVDERMLSWR